MSRMREGGAPKDLALPIRKTERLESDGWEPIPFHDIKGGDIFRLFDDCPNPIETGKPYTACGDAYLNSDGVGTVKIWEDK